MRVLCKEKTEAITKTNGTGVSFSLSLLEFQRGDTFWTGGTVEKEDGSWKGRSSGFGGTSPWERLQPPRKEERPIFGNCQINEEKSADFILMGRQ